MIQMKDDPENHQAEFEGMIAKLPSRLQPVWAALKEAVDTEFASLNRAWRSRGYLVRADNVFLSLRPNPRRRRIEVRAHLTREALPSLQDIFVSDQSRKQADRPRVQCLLVEDAADIPKILVAANAALKVSGQKQS